MQDWVLVYLVRDGRVLLARKMNSLFRGHRFSYGGKVEPGETPECAAVREVWEEVRVRVRAMRTCGVIRFHQGTRVRVCHLFVALRWLGTPTHTHEMQYPRWFAVGELPHRMGPARDRRWVRYVLAQPATAWVEVDAGTHFLRPRYYVPCRGHRKR